VPPREWRLRVEDILAAAERAIGYTASMDRANFLADQRTIDAVARCVEIIGEASRFVPDEICAVHPAVPWRLMRGMRNVLAHEYFGVTDETLWKTVREDLPAILEPLRAVLR
jgi:uncharacterized protein with HEPN domain